MEKELIMILKAYGIPREVYFKFLDVIREIDFDDKEYKDFLIKEYKEFISKIDDIKIDDINKIKCKTQILKVMERYKGKSEKNNMIGKVILGVA